MCFKRPRTEGGGGPRWGEASALKDILGAFNETVAELSDPDVANQRRLIVP